MIINIGLITLVLAGGCALFGLLASAWGIQTRRADWAMAGRNALIALWPLLSLALLALIYANLTDDYRLEYTAQVSSRATPILLKITAVWGGQNGSLLFWSWLMASFALAVLIHKWGWRSHLDDDALFQAQAPQAGSSSDLALMPYITVVLAAIQVFFIALTLILANPFARLWLLPDGQIEGFILPPAGSTPFTPQDGNGLAALLRHPGMTLHPPFLYLGFVGFSVPFAFALAALISGRLDDGWLRSTRRWTLMAWLFLSLGLLLGARWAYDVLGWGGYWGWDPVENAALLPWLSGTAFIHSVMIQEKRGMLRVWNMFLIILTFCQVILGTFITRTGVISSVHSFARSSIGLPFLIFTAAILLGSMGLLLFRLERLKSQQRLERLLSREAIFLLQNVLFVLINFVVALGSYFPILSELFTRDKITVGPPYYYQTVGPLLVPLLLLMGVAPLVSWRSASWPALARGLWSPALATLLGTALIFVMDGKNGFALLGFGLIIFSALVTLMDYARGVFARHKASGEPYLLAAWNIVGRNRRRYGGYLVHMAVVLIAVGIIGTHFYQAETQRTLEPGDSLALPGYTLRFIQLENVPSPEPDKRLIAARLSVSDSRGATRLMRPFQELYDSGDQMTPPALWSSLKEDLYVLLIGWEADGSSVSLKIFVNPLVNWLWLGGLVFIAGTLVAAWPSSRSHPYTQRARPVEEVIG